MSYRHQISYWFRFGNNSFLITTFFLSLRHGLGAILRAEKADLEQIQKVVRLITCERSFSQNVSGLIPRVNVPDLDLTV